MQTKAWLRLEIWGLHCRLLSVTVKESLSTWKENSFFRFSSVGRRELSPLPLLLPEAVPEVMFGCFMLLRQSPCRELIQNFFLSVVVLTLGKSQKLFSADPVNKVDEDTLYCFYSVPFCGMALSSSKTLRKEAFRNCFRKWQ